MFRPLHSRTASRFRTEFFVTLAALGLALALLSKSAIAATYYVSPNGGGTLSQDPAAPGSLDFATTGTGSGAGAANSGDTVILEDGVYSTSPDGYRLYNPGVTFRAKTWHGASIINRTSGNLVGSDTPTAHDITWQGVVFGPSTGQGWSGGGRGKWVWRDCAFIGNGGVGSGDGTIFERDLFSDAHSNGFDVSGGPDKPAMNVTWKDVVMRRDNRDNADDDGVGNKECFSRNFVFDDYISYDNNGTSLWFDTDNDDWVVKNSTFFANHGGNNWYYCGVATGISTTQFTATGQDGEGIAVGQPVKCISKSGPNAGAESFVTAVSGNNPQTLTVSPAIPAPPNSSEIWLLQQMGASSGDGFTSEANDGGTFTDNVCYSNTDRGIYDHASGGQKHNTKGTIVVTNNLFVDNGQSYNFWPDGRDDGPAIVQFNRFKFVPGKNLAFGSGGGSLGSYTGGQHISFDYNIYDPGNTSGQWAEWSASSPAEVVGGLTNDSHAKGLDYLQDPGTWNQDRHSTVAAIQFRGSPVASYIFPASKDSKWSHVFQPNNVFGLTNSIHQIDDTDGAVKNTIDQSIAGHASGDVVFVPVSGHTPIVDNTCEVYDLNGRWVTLTVSPTDQGAFLDAVPPYVTCTTGNKTVTYPIRLVLGSVDQYDITAAYTQTNGVPSAAVKIVSASPGDSQATLAWSVNPNALSYTVYRGSDSAPANSVPVATGVSLASYTDSGLTDGKTYYYWVKAVNSYGSSPYSNIMSAAPQVVSGSVTGNGVWADNSAAGTSGRFSKDFQIEPGVTVSQTAPPNYDLTTFGAIDWRQFGDFGGENTKAAGGGQISDLTQIGTGLFGRWGSTPCTVSWSDSSSRLANAGDDGFIWANTQVGSGWSFTVPADSTSRTLTLIWGGATDATIKVNAHLSDGSAPDYSHEQYVNGNGTRIARETINYNAATAGQTLLVTLTLSAAVGKQNPSIDLMAIALK
jgi:hypothetical protein